MPFRFLKFDRANENFLAHIFEEKSPNHKSESLKPPSELVDTYATT